MKKIFLHQWQDLIKGKCSTDDYFQKIFLDPIFQDLQIQYKDYINYWLEYDKYVNLEMLNLIKSLKVPCYIGTNQKKYRTDNIIKNIGNYFQGYFASYEIGYMKPENMFFQYIESAL